MRLVIAGSRTLRPTMAEIEAAVLLLVGSVLGDLADVTEVISGEANGPDAAGREWAMRRGIAVHKEPITAEDIAKHGKYMGPKMRNRRMAERGDACIALWDGRSGGTSDMVCRMVARGKIVRVIPMRPPVRRRG